MAPDILGLELQHALQRLATEGWEVTVVLTRAPGRRTEDVGTLRVARWLILGERRGVITAVGQQGGKGGAVLAYRITDDCQACGTCAESCPNQAIVEGVRYHIDPEKCEECGTCFDVCPAGAVVRE